MCGIAGWVDFQRDLTGEEQILAAMTESMHNRGPDASGIFLDRHAALGHRRLIVLDPEGGTQPMAARRRPCEDPVVLTYSGEIYNFTELRSELASKGHRFETRSDTEVVLHCYLEWGVNFPSRLNGMFALAIWDPGRDELVLVRDRFGVKPLYYHPYPGGLIFASEPKGVMANPLFRPQLAETSLPFLFNPRITPPGLTPLKDLYEVKPAHVVRVNASGVTESCYWKLESNSHYRTFGTVVSNVRDLLEDIVDRHVTADVPIASMLSGGLDSSVISALAVRALKRHGTDEFRTFSIDYEDRFQQIGASRIRPDHDGPHARLVARHIGSVHQELVLNPADSSTALAQATLARDLPCLGEYDASLYRAFSEVRRHATVALAGEGADEVFGGYHWYRDRRHVETATFPWISLRPDLMSCLSADVRRRVPPGETERALYEDIMARVPRSNTDDAIEARMREVLFASLANPLGFLLDRKDRMSMAVGLEVRVPYLDHRLVEYMWNVPWDLKNADGSGKSILRAAAADLLPQGILQRPKSAYPSAWADGYAASVTAEVERLLQNPVSPLFSLLDPRRIRALILRAPTATSCVEALGRLMSIEQWMREYRIQLAA
ncbi:asparagine synthase (glutamine-hydrolyzing) [Kitasatospora sp. NPDC056783]|uniref:asparagine synthase (glutamine-hydrolyzing) n=1 Tax=Kitasatospora sp. NPDC056783 TaxID=3345943 RepID=UPI0036ACAFC6